MQKNSIDGFQPIKEMNEITEYSTVFVVANICERTPTF